MEATIQAKAQQAAVKFLESKDYGILEEGWAHGSDSVDIIARDGEDLVFCDVLVEASGLDMPEEQPDRGRFERIAAAYLATTEADGSFEVRYDVISILVVSGSRALLRHHINALSVAE